MHFRKVCDFVCCPRISYHGFCAAPTRLWPSAQFPGPVMVLLRPENWPVPRSCCRKPLPVVGSILLSCTTAHFCPDLDIVEVAHDIAQSVSSYITKGLKLVNSYDTWHGMPSIFGDSMTLFLRDKECGQVPEDYLPGSTEAHRRDLVSRACRQTYVYFSVRMTLWTGFLSPEKNIKIHLYWAMKNCEGDAAKLCALIENIPNHYQVL